MGFTTEESGHKLNTLSVSLHQPVVYRRCIEVRQRSCANGSIQCHDRRIRIRVISFLRTCRRTKDGQVTRCATHNDAPEVEHCDPATECRLRSGLVDGRVDHQVYHRDVPGSTSFATRWRRSFYSDTPTTTSPTAAHYSPWHRHTPRPVPGTRGERAHDHRGPRTSP